MSIRTSVAVLGVVALGALPLMARQSMSEEEYGKAMTEIRFLVGDANLHIDARYWPDLSEDVAKLRTQFESVQAFWEARGNDAAVGFAQAAIDALEPILVAGDDRDQGAARSAVRGLQSTCTPCHDEFREETADGFRIKD